MDIDVSKNKFFKLLLFHCLLVLLETTLDETFILTDTFRIILRKKIMKLCAIVKNHFRDGPLF